MSDVYWVLLNSIEYILLLVSDAISKSCDYIKPLATRNHPIGFQGSIFNHVWRLRWYRLHMGLKKVFRCWLFCCCCCWEILTLVTDPFLLMPIDLLSFFFFSFFFFFVVFVCWSCKRIKNGKEKDKDTFNLNFYFWGVECFPEPVEITVLASLGVKGISGIIFDKLWIWDSAICVCVQFNWRCYELEKQRAAKADWQPREKGVSVSVETVNDSAVEFLFDARKPIFQAYTDCASCPRPPGILLFLYLLILFHFFPCYWGFIYIYIYIYNSISTDLNSKFGMITHTHTYIHTQTHKYIYIYIYIYKFYIWFQIFKFDEFHHSNIYFDYLMFHKK